MGDKLDDLQHADFMNQKLKKKLVNNKFELEEEEKNHDRTIVEANERIATMKVKNDKQKAQIKQLKKDVNVVSTAYDRKKK